MGDNSEYRLLSISIKKPPKYGSILSKDLTQRQNYITHNVQKDETLQGIALKYNVSMEKIKRANNLWTSDSLFLRPTLSIPIDKPKIEEESLNGTEANGHQLDRSLNSTNSTNSSSNTSSSYLNGNHNNSSMNSSSASSSNEHNNNLDYKISLNEIQPDLQSTQSISDPKPSTSNHNLNGDDNEMLRGKDESMDDFLSRIDQYIKQSKVKADSFATSSEIISSQSDDDLFKLHNYGHGRDKSSFRQHSLRNNDICLHEIRDEHHNREIIYSLRKLEKEQEEREKYEL